MVLLRFFYNVCDELNCSEPDRRDTLISFSRITRMGHSYFFILHYVVIAFVLCLLVVTIRSPQQWEGAQSSIVVYTPCTV